MNGDVTMVIALMMIDDAMEGLIAETIRTNKIVSFVYYLK